MNDDLNPTILDGKDAFEDYRVSPHLLKEGSIEKSKCGATGPAGGSQPLPDALPSPHEIPPSTKGSQPVKDPREEKYGFGRKFSESSTADLLTTYHNQKSTPGTGGAQTYFMFALVEELKKRNELPAE